MSESGDPLSRHADLAIQSAALDLGVPAIDLARRLGAGEIARLLHLLNAALRHVDNPGLRRRIEDTLLAITDGRMPSQSPESELDWALKVARERRTGEGSLPDDDES